MLIHAGLSVDISISVFATRVYLSYFNVHLHIFWGEKLPEIVLWRGMLVKTVLKSA